MFFIGGVDTSPLSLLSLVFFEIISTKDVFLGTNETSCLTALTFCLCHPYWQGIHLQHCLLVLLEHFILKNMTLAL